MTRERRPDWAWDVYTAWRKRSPAAQGHVFEMCGWFRSGTGWARQNDDGMRVTVFADGSVTLTESRSWL